MLVGDLVPHPVLAATDCSAVPSTNPDRDQATRETIPGRRCPGQASIHVSKRLGCPLTRDYRGITGMLTASGVVRLVAPDPIINPPTTHPLLGDKYGTDHPLQHSSWSSDYTLTGETQKSGSTPSSSSRSGPIRFHSPEPCRAFPDTRRRTGGLPGARGEHAEVVQQACLRGSTRQPNWPLLAPTCSVLVSRACEGTC